MARSIVRQYASGLACEHASRSRLPLENNGIHRKRKKKKSGFRCLSFLLIALSVLKEMLKNAIKIIVVFNAVWTAGDRPSCEHTGESRRFTNGGV